MLSTGILEVTFELVLEDCIKILILKSWDKEKGKREVHRLRMIMHFQEQ